VESNCGFTRKNYLLEMEMRHYLLFCFTLQISKLPSPIWLASQAATNWNPLQNLLETVILN
jgi:hypothetical protein